MMDLKTVTRAAGCIALLASLAGCKKQEPASMGPAPAIEATAPGGAPAPPPPPEARPAAPGADTAVTAASTAQQMGSSAATYTDSERKFIRVASARFRVKDVYVAALGIEDIVASHGGFVVKNDIAATEVSTRTHPIGNGKLMDLQEYAVQGELVVRVPSARTQEFLRAIVGHIVFLDQRNFSAEDAQFKLLRQQLDMIRNQETQAALGQAIEDGGKLAQKAEAISTRGDVKAARDAAAIAKKEFEDAVAFSTISLALHQPTKVLQLERVDVDSMERQLRPGFFSRLGEQLRGGWEGLLEFLLVLAIIWPVWVIGGVLGTVLWRFKRRRPGNAVET